MAMQRRQFLLTAAGLPFYLPLLEGLLTPQEVKADVATPAPFMVVYKNGVGRESGKFFPTKAGPITKASLVGTTAEIYGDYADKLLLLDGLEHWLTSNTGCSHALASCLLLTGANAYKTGGDGTEVATKQSLDYIIARQLANKDPIAAAACELQGHHPDLSWSGKGARMPLSRNPYTLYTSLFPSGIGSGGTTTQAPNQDAVKATQLLEKSVNDVLRDQIKKLENNPRLSADDQKRLQQHFTAIREVEKGIGAAGQAELTIQPDVLKSINDKKGWSVDNDATWKGKQMEIARLHASLIALAFASGLNRAATLAMGIAIDFNTYEGFDEAFHKTSHKDETKFKDSAQRHQVLLSHDQMFAKGFKHLLDKLSEHEVNGKPLLDYGCALWMNDMGPHSNNGDQGHAQTGLQFALAGSCNGILKQGHLVNLKGVVNNRLLATIGAAVGLKEGGQPITKFQPEDAVGSNANRGKEATGRIEDLFAKVPT